LEVRAEDPDLSLIVKDNGIGFDERVAAHLFERFRQGDSSTTRQFGGIGLGLGIVRHLVELHGGTVAGESPGPKRGATFRVRLPLRRAGENANAPAIAPRVDVSPDRPTPQAGIADRHPPPA
jgi:signal transduction histidine kinase